VVQSVVVFAMQQLQCPTTATLAGQFLPLQIGAIQFCASPSIPGDELSVCHAPTLDGWCLLNPALSLCSLPCPCLLRVRLLAPPLFSKVGSEFYPTPTVSGRLQFTVSVFQLCPRGHVVCPRAALEYVQGVWEGAGGEKWRVAFLKAGANQDWIQPSRV
jgi:hypothetical protein